MTVTVTVTSRWWEEGIEGFGVRGNMFLLYAATGSPNSIPFPSKEATTQGCCRARIIWMLHQCPLQLSDGHGPRRDSIGESIGVLLRERVAVKVAAVVPNLRGGTQLKGEPDVDTTWSNQSRIQGLRMVGR